MKTAATKIAKLVPSLGPLLESLRASANYQESDCVAVIRREKDNVTSWLPVHLRESDGAPCVWMDDAWREVENMPGFMRYEKVHRRKYDTATGKVIEIA